MYPKNMGACYALLSITLLFTPVVSYSMKSKSLVLYSSTKQIRNHGLSHGTYKPMDMDSNGCEFQSSCGTKSFDKGLINKQEMQSIISEAKSHKVDTTAIQLINKIVTPFQKQSPFSFNGTKKKGLFDIVKGKFALPQERHDVLEMTPNGEHQPHIVEAGPIGATIGAATGKFFVYAVKYSIVAASGWVANMVSGPAAAAIVGGAVESTLAVPTEFLSNKMAIAGGIIGGTLTGPV